MQEMMLYASQDSVYSIACANLEKYLGYKVDAKQMERLVHAYGNDVAEEFDSFEGKILPLAKEGERTYVMMDGSMISTRNEGWKEVKLGRIFAASDHLPADTNRNWIRDSVYIGVLASATLKTIQLKLFKVAVKVKEMKTRIKLEFPSAIGERSTMTKAFEVFRVLRC